MRHLRNAPLSLRVWSKSMLSKLFWFALLIFISPKLGTTDFPFPNGELSILQTPYQSESVNTTWPDSICTNSISFFLRSRIIVVPGVHSKPFDILIWERKYQFSVEREFYYHDMYFVASGNLGHRMLAIWGFTITKTLELDTLKEKLLCCARYHIVRITNLVNVAIRYRFCHALYVWWIDTIVKYLFFYHVFPLLWQLFFVSVLALKIVSWT